MTEGRSVLLLLGFRRLACDAFERISLISSGSWEYLDSPR